LPLPPPITLLYCDDFFRFCVFAWRFRPGQGFAEW